MSLFSEGGCPGCWTTQRGMQQEIERVKVQAKQFAIEQNTVVAIYREGYEVSFIRADLSAGYNVVDRVTPY